MHWQLIAGIDWFLTPDNWPIILEVALGIGMVIFVHELGHFAVAKACGVKCEKFYLGFDIGGWKLFKYKWGETEYGIGVLPLGGYVKMLGQDDNPNRLREETERAKLKTTEGESVEDDGDSVFDPRSYLAKSVPQRMAIISAGVIMNVIFAFVVFSTAYGIGVQQVACEVGKLLAGEAAWRGGMHQGDDIQRIGKVKKPVFRDLQTGIALGDNLDKGIEFEVRRHGTGKVETVTLVPEVRRRRPTIGMHPNTNCLLAKPPVNPYVEVAQRDLGLEPDDLVVAVNGHAVADSVALDRELSANLGTVTLTIERTIKMKESGAATDPAAKVKRFDVDVPQVPMRTVGLVMEMGKVTAIQNGSPAEASDLRPGDRIVAVDGEAVGDPLRLPLRMSARAGEKSVLTVERDGKRMEKEVTLVDGVLDETAPATDSAVALPAIGLAYAVENIVAAVEPGSAAAQSGLKPGDEITEAKLIAPDETVQREKHHIKEVQRDTKPLSFEGKRNWPVLFAMMQAYLPDTRLELTLRDGRTATLELQPSADWLNADRGLVFQAVAVTQKAETFSEALTLGGRETRESLSMVFRFLRKIFSGQVSVKDIGGPVLIAEQAGASASEGLSPFLLFLGMLSANLAVLNFLPIPMLDGGHMVFLAAEGVRGKPVSERVVACFQFAGLFLLASLMIFVLLLDVGVIPRG